MEFWQRRVQEDMDNDLSSRKLEQRLAEWKNTSSQGRMLSLKDCAAPEAEDDRQMTPDEKANLVLRIKKLNAEQMEFHESIAQAKVEQSDLASQKHEKRLNAWKKKSARGRLVSTKNSQEVINRYHARLEEIHAARPPCMTQTEKIRMCTAKSLLRKAYETSKTHLRSKEEIKQFEDAQAELASLKAALIPLRDAGVDLESKLYRSWKRESSLGRLSRFKQNMEAIDRFKSTIKNRRQGRRNGAH